MSHPSDPYAPPALDDILEAVLLAAGEPVSLERIESVLQAGPAVSSQTPSRAAIRESLTKLAARLNAGGTLELAQTASGYRVRILQRYSPWVSRLWDERAPRYSRALLETLALIAYRQPVTRGDIEEVRGVAVSSSIMRTLLERGWIRVVGQRDVPGRPAVYATTRAFLDDLGLKSLDALPPMHDFQSVETFETAMHEPFIEAPLPDTTGFDAPDTEELTPRVHTASSEATLATEASSRPSDTHEHAETASPGQSLSFAELEARLADRAQKRTAERHTPTDADTPEAPDERDDSRPGFPAADEARKDS